MQLKKQKEKCVLVPSAAGGSTAGDSRSQRRSSSLWELLEKQRSSASFRCHNSLPACSEWTAPWPCVSTANPWRASYSWARKQVSKKVFLWFFFSPFFFFQALVQRGLVRAGLQGCPRQAAGSSCISSDLLRLPETSDCCPQHQQEQHVCGLPLPVHDCWYSQLPCFSVHKAHRNIKRNLNYSVYFCT